MKYQQSNRAPLKCIKNPLTDLKIFMEGGGSSLPQESVLSLQLFNIFINNLMINPVDDKN